MLLTHIQFSCFVSKFSEYVWLSITFGAFYLIRHLVQGTLDGIDSTVSWDPYLIMYIDDIKYTSKSYLREFLGWTLVNERFYAKIKKTSTIRFEIWDDDSHQFLRGGDDPLFDKTYKIDELPNRIPDLPNQNYYLYVDFIKMDDYKYDFELVK